MIYSSVLIELFFFNEILIVFLWLLQFVEEYLQIFKDYFIHHIIPILIRILKSAITLFICHQEMQFNYHSWLLTSKDLAYYATMII